MVLSICTGSSWHPWAGVPEAVADHVAHWRGLGLDDYTEGPFEDRTGCLITFRAEGTSQAEEAAASDRLPDADWWRPTGSQRSLPE
jgi:hypothetical protein